MPAGDLAQVGGGLSLTPGNLITHLRKLEDAGYVTTVKTGAGVTARTSVSLTPDGRGRTSPLYRRTATARRGCLTTARLAVTRPAPRQAAPGRRNR